MLIFDSNTSFSLLFRPSTGLGLRERREYLDSCYVGEGVTQFHEGRRLPTLGILGDLGAISRDDRMFVVKVYYKIEKSPTPCSHCLVYNAKLTF